MATARSGSTPRSRLIVELSAQSALLGDRILAGLRAEIPVYTDRPETELRPAILSSLRSILQPVERGRPCTEAELAEFRSYGELRARQGIPNEEILRAWRLSLRVVLDELTILGRRRRISATTLLDVTRDLLDATDAAILAFSQGHHQAELGMARRDQQHRTDFVRGVLLATLGPAEIGQQAHRYGLDPERDYHPIRVRPSEHVPMEALERWLGLVFDSARSRGLIAVLDGDVAGFVDRMPGAEIATTVGVGPPGRLDQLAPSFRRATRALATATAFGMTGACDLARLGLLPAVLADTDVSEELVRRYVEPLGTGEGTRLILETVRHYLASGMRADVTAEELSVHHNTVRYRLRRYELLTGVDLRGPGHAPEAWWALQYARLERPLRARVTT